MKESSGFTLYEQVLFKYRLKLYALFIEWKNESALYIDRCHLRLVGL